MGAKLELIETNLTGNALKKEDEEEKEEKMTLNDLIKVTFLFYFSFCFLFFFPIWDYYYSSIPNIYNFLLHLFLFKKMIIIISIILLLLIFLFQP